MVEALDTRMLFGVMAAALWRIRDESNDIASTIRENADDPESFLIGASGDLTPTINRISAAVDLIRATVRLAQLTSHTPFDAGDR